MCAPPFRRIPPPPPTRQPREGRPHWNHDRALAAGRADRPRFEGGSASFSPPWPMVCPHTRATMAISSVARRATATPGHCLTTSGSAVILRSILCTLCRRRRAVFRLAVLRVDQVAAQEPLLIVRRSRSPHDDKHYREPRRLGRRRPRDIVCRPWPGTAHGTVSSQGRLLAKRAARTQSPGYQGPTKT